MITHVVKVGGKQYVIKPGMKIVVDRVAGEIGNEVTFTDLLTDKPVKAKIVKSVLGDKVMTRRFRNKSRYTRTLGHRQPSTLLEFSVKVAENK